MYRRRLASMAVCSAAFLLLNGAAAVPDKASEDLLKSKGLTRVGTTYLLDADINIAQGLRTIRAAQKNAEDSGKRRVNLERDIKGALSTMESLDAQNRTETAALEKINKMYDFTYNQQVYKVNAIRTKLRQGQVYIQKRQEALRDMGDPGDEYVTGVLKLSDGIEAAATAYDALGKDPEVKGALEKINQTAPSKFMDLAAGALQISMITKESQATTRPAKAEH